MLRKMKERIKEKNKNMDGGKANMDNENKRYEEETGRLIEFGSVRGRAV